VVYYETPAHIGTIIEIVPVTRERAAYFSRIQRLLNEGKLLPRVAPGGVFSFARAADAFRMVEVGGFRGRVLITFGT
jgi:NADPH:quinone reductase-like Zn-dependent oxidoreductase